jgi:transcription initiation factor TFIIIB Brf1 subunit/transcription initiation factor TFIIB
MLPYLTLLYLGKDLCPFCLSTKLVFDNVRDMNVCASCGAVAVP